MTVGCHKLNQAGPLLEAMVLEAASLLEQTNTVPDTYGRDLASVFLSRLSD